MPDQPCGPEAGYIKAPFSTAIENRAGVSFLAGRTHPHTDNNHMGQTILASSALNQGDPILGKSERGRRMKAYPEMPGSKGVDGTSQAAAANVAPRVTGMRKSIFEAIARLGDVTALELVEHTGMDRYSVQPRVSELRAMGLVESTGERRKNPSGQLAAVQRLTEKGRALL